MPTTQRRSQTRRQLETWCDARDIRGVGHAPDAQYSMASVEQDFWVVGPKAKHAKKSAPRITTAKQEAKI